MKIYKAKVSAVTDLIVTVRELENGEVELVEVDEILDVEEFENVRPI